VKLAKVGHLYVLLEACLEGIHSSGAVCSNHAVIHMHSDDNEDSGGLGMFIEHSLVNLTLHDDTLSRP
jgi:hypothetical protein